MDRYKLDDYISVVVPEQMEVTFQAFPELGLETPVLCIWDRGQLQCLLSVDEQPNGQDDEDYWMALDTELRLNIFGIKVVKEGEYLSQYHGNVSYRIYRDPTGSKASTQIYHLIHGAKKTYFVIAALYHYEELFVTNSQIIQLLKTARVDVSSPSIAH